VPLADRPQAEDEATGAGREAILAGINTVKSACPTQRSHSSSLRVRASVSNMMGMPSRTG
jgi:hypothetical protein